MCLKYLWFLYILKMSPFPNEISTGIFSQLNIIVNILVGIFNNRVHNDVYDLDDGSTVIHIISIH